MWLLRTSCVLLLTLRPSQCAPSADPNRFDKLKPVTLSQLEKIAPETSEYSRSISEPNALTDAESSELGHELFSGTIFELSPGLTSDGAAAEAAVDEGSRAKLESVEREMELRMAALWDAINEARARTLAEVDVEAAASEEDLPAYKRGSSLHTRIAHSTSGQATA